MLHLAKRLRLIKEKFGRAISELYCPLLTKSCQKWYNGVMKKSFVNKLAFTLVELVVVIAILGILGTAAGLAIASAKRDADRKQAMTKLRTVFESCNAVMSELSSGFSLVDGTDTSGVVGLITQRTGLTTSSSETDTLKKLVSCVLIPSCTCVNPSPGELYNQAKPPKNSNDEYTVSGFYILYRFCDPSIEKHSPRQHPTDPSTSHTPDPADCSYFIDTVWLVFEGKLYYLDRTTPEPVEEISF